MVLKCLLLLLPVSTWGWTASSASSANRYFPSKQGYARSSSSQQAGFSIYPPSGYRGSKTPAVDYYYNDDTNNDKNGYYKYGQSTNRYRYTKSSDSTQQQSFKRNSSPYPSSSSYNRPSSNSYYSSSSNNGNYNNDNNNDNYYSQQGQIYPTSSYQNQGYLPFQSTENRQTTSRSPYKQSWNQDNNGPTNSWTPYDRQSYGSSRSSSRDYYGNQYYALSPDNVDSVTGLGTKVTYPSGSRAYNQPTNLVRYQAPDVGGNNSYNHHNNYPTNQRVPYSSARTSFAQQHYSVPGDTAYESSGDYPYSPPRRTTTNRGYDSYSASPRTSDNYYTHATTSRRSSGILPRPLQQLQRQW